MLLLRTYLRYTNSEKKGTSGQRGGGTERRLIDTLTGGPACTPSATPTKPTYVRWTRNFQRLKKSSQFFEVGVVEVHEGVLEPSDPSNLLILSGIAHKTN